MSFQPNGHDFRAPWWGIAAILLSVAAATIASVFSADFQPMLSKVLRSPETRIFGFVALAVSAALLVTLRQLNFDAARTDAERQLIRQARSLEDLIKLVPSRQVLHAASLASEASANALTKHSKDEASVESLIRDCLQAATLFVPNFNPVRGAKYASNLMIPRDPETHGGRLKSKIRFSAKDPDRLTAVLELIPELSSDEEGRADVTETLALPVDANHDQSASKSELLPGAPLALVENRANDFNDTLMLADHCRKHCDLTERQAGEILSYFKEMGGSIRSFVSVPIGFEGEDPICVLNIHSSHRSILGGQTLTLEGFDRLLSPVKCALKILVADYLEQENAESSPPG